MKKIIVTLLSLLLTITSVGFVPLNAESLLDEPFIIEIDNVIHEFPNEETYELFIVDSMKRLGTSGESTLVFSSPTGKMQIGMHPFTPYWTYAASYYINVSKTETYSLSKLYNGYTFTASITTESGVGITVNANSSRQSKLAVYGYGDYRRTKWDIYNYGVYQYTYYTNVIRMRPGSQSIEVYYR